MATGNKKCGIERNLFRWLCSTRPCFSCPRESGIYTILLHDVRSALKAVGLDSAVGYLHRDRPGRLRRVAKICKNHFGQEWVELFNRDCLLKSPIYLNSFESIGIVNLIKTQYHICGCTVIISIFSKP